MSAPLIPAGVVIPDLYAAEGQGEAALVYAHLVHPLTEWHWYVLEVSREDEDRIFALVDGWALELSYASLAELEANGVKTDADWQPRPLSEVRRDCELRHVFLD